MVALLVNQVNLVTSLAALGYALLLRRPRPTRNRRGPSSLRRPGDRDLRTPALARARSYHGPQALLEAFDNLSGQFEDFSAEVERIEAADDDIVVQVHHRGRGREKGTPVDAGSPTSYTIRDGIRWEMFDSWEQVPTRPASWIARRRRRHRLSPTLVSATFTGYAT